MSASLLAAIDAAGDALTVVYDAARSTDGVTKEQAATLKEKVRHLCDTVTDGLMNIQSCLDCNSYEDVNQPDRFLEPFGDNCWICPQCAEARHG